MVVEAYPGKSTALLGAAVSETRKIGKDTMYVEMAKPKYFGKVNLKEFSFTEIPRCIAFLYYSGSYMVVFLGMFVLATLLMGTEVLVTRAAGNPFFNALWGQKLPIRLLK